MRNERMYSTFTRSKNVATGKLLSAGTAVSNETARLGRRACNRVRDAPSDEDRSFDFLSSYSPATPILGELFSREFLTCPSKPSIDSIERSEIGPAYDGRQMASSLARLA
jgi:hypothetical protein